MYEFALWSVWEHIAVGLLVMGGMLGLFFCYLNPRISKIWRGIYLPLVLVYVVAISFLIASIKGCEFDFIKFIIEIGKSLVGIK